MCFLDSTWVCASRDTKEIREKVGTRTGIYGYIDIYGYIGNIYGYNVDQKNTHIAL